jgi:hypothetical protein
MLAIKKWQYILLMRLESPLLLIPVIGLFRSHNIFPVAVWEFYDFLIGIFHKKHPLSIIWKNKALAQVLKN